MRLGTRVFKWRNIEVGRQILTSEVKIKFLQRDHYSDGDRKEISQ